MPPKKKGNSKKGSAAVKEEDVFEKVDLEKFSEESYLISFIIPESGIEKPFLDLFIKGGLERSRKAVVLIAKDKMLSSVSKDVKKILETDNTKLALFIQQQIYKLLTENEQMLLEKKEADEAKIEGTENAGDKLKPSDKLNTKGKESKAKEKPIVNIEDQPEDGPSLYIAICGFENISLITELIKLSISISSIIKIVTIVPEIQPPTPPVEGSDTFLSTASVEDNDSPAYIPPPKETIKVNATVPLSVYDRFWNDYNLIRFDLTMCEVFKDIAVVDYNIADIECIGSMVTIIYDKTCFLLYDIDKLRKQHKNYLRNMRVFNVDQTSYKTYEMDNYMDHIDNIPQECETVPVFLHCVLEEVVEKYAEMKRRNIFLEEEENSSSVSSVRVEIPEEMLKECEENKSNDTEVIRDTENDAESKYKKLPLKIDPYVVTFENFAELMSLHFKNKQFLNIYDNTNKYLIFNRLFALADKSDSVERMKYNYHVNKLLQFMDTNQISKDNFCRILHLLAFEQITSIDSKDMATIQKWYSIGSERVYPCTSLSFPKVDRVESPKKLKSMSTFEQNYEPGCDAFLCPEIEYLINDNQVDKDLNENEDLLYYLNEYTMIEPLSYNILMQSLQESFKLFLIVHYEYYAPTDSILVHFKNSKRIISKTSWSGSLPTPVCFRDFSDYVVDEEKVWLENLHPVKNAAELTEKNCTADICVKPSEDFRCCDNEYFYPVTNKDEIIKKQVLEKKLQKTLKDLTCPEGIHPDIVLPMLNLKTTQSFNAHIDRKYDYYGYNLSSDRTQINGEETLFFPNGIKIKVKLCQWLYYSKQLYLQISTSRFEFYCSNEVSDETKETDLQPQPLNFHFIAKNGVIFAFQQNIYPTDITYRCASNTETQRSSKTAPNENKSKTTEDTCNTQPNLDKDSKEVDEKNEEFFFLNFSYKCSWPNGLTIEILPCLTEPHIIRQIRTRVKNSDTQPSFSTLGNISNFSSYDVNSDSETNHSMHSAHIINTEVDPVIGIIPYHTEEKRLFTRNGMLVAFNLDGSVLIFSPGGMQIWCAADKVDQCCDATSVLFKCMDDYLAILPNGKQYEVSNSEVIDKGKLMYRTAVDFKNGETVIRRGDGTNVLFTKEKMITTFPDTTKITTSFFVEDNKISVVPENNDKRSEDGTVSEESNESFSTRAFGKNIITDRNAWIVVTLTCSYEHPDYATVRYNKQLQSVVSMPDKLEIRSSLTGEHEIYFGDMEKINIDKDITNIGCVICEHCLSKTDIQLYHSSNLKEISSILAAAQDSYRNKFYVYRNGECTFEGFNKNTLDCKFPQGCTSMDPDMMNRYFVIHKSLEGEKLLRKAFCDKYVEETKYVIGTNHTEFKNNSGEKECIQTLVPLKNHPLKKWKMPYLPIKPESLKNEDLQFNDIRQFYKAPFPIIKTKPVEEKRTQHSSEILINRHFCVIPENARKIVYDTIKKYIKWGQIEARKWKAQISTRILLEPYQARIEQRLAQATIGGITEPVTAFASVSSEIVNHLYGDKILPTITTDAQKALLANREETHKREILYREALRGYLLSPHFPSTWQRSSKNSMYE